MTEEATINNINQLIDRIGAGNPDPDNSGYQDLVRLIWAPDGRIITARYCGEDFSTADIDVKVDPIDDDEIIRPHAEALLRDGKPIKVLMGGSDDTVFMEWTISSTSPVIDFLRAKGIDITGEEDAEAIETIAAAFVEGVGNLPRDIAVVFKGMVGESLSELGLEGDNASVVSTMFEFCLTEFTRISLREYKKAFS